MSHPLLITHYASPLGQLSLGDFEGKLCLCEWTSSPHHSLLLRRLSHYFGATPIEGTTATHEQAIEQLEAYFAAQRTTFSVPLIFAGTAFQQAVWHALMQIPYGTTVSYAHVAQHIGHPQAVRAVGTANATNAISIFVPCHRVIGTNGRLTGYAGGLNVKRQLLTLEQAHTDIFAENP